MYAAFRKEREGNSNLLRFKLVDGKISLFGCNEGWIPWLLEMAMPKGQQEPYRWHLALQEALGDEKAKQYAAKQYNSEGFPVGGADC